MDVVEESTQRVHGMERDSVVGTISAQPTSCVIMAWNPQPLSEVIQRADVAVCSQDISAMSHKGEALEV